MEIRIKTSKKQEMIDITEKVNELVKNEKKGICNVYITHATAAIVINENYDPNVCIDTLNALNKVFPDHAGYTHDKIDNNAGAHIKATILGPSETIPIENGKLKLGTWQALMMVELDGPKSERTINVEIVKS